MTDESFLESFAAATIPREEWRHRDHVRAAYLSSIFSPSLARLWLNVRNKNS